MLAMLAIRPRWPCLPAGHTAALAMLARLPAALAMLAWPAGLTAALAMLA